MAHTYTNKAFSKTTLVTNHHTIFLDIIILSMLLIFIYFIFILASAYHTPFRQNFTIDLSLSALPRYAILSTGRMTIAYIFSLLFSFIYAKLALTNKKIEGILIPVLDILQSIPILSFMPGIVLLLVALFPDSNIGLEISAVILIFTSQVWNITFGFYQTLLTIPQDLNEVSIINHLGFWHKFTRLEIPAGMISLIWNSMMSWAGGWFFLIASEQFTLGNKSFQLPGLGSYLQAAANKGDFKALLFGLLTLVFVIVLLDQFLWRPLVAWGDKFKIEQDQSDEISHSWVLNLLKKSSLIRFINTKIDLPLTSFIDRAFSSIPHVKIYNKYTLQTNTIWFKTLKILFTLLLISLFFLGFVQVILHLQVTDWKMIGIGAAATLGRTIIELILSLLWTVPVGVAIGLNPNIAKRIQPIVQLAASIPATALFPVILLTLLVIPSGLSIAAIILMLLGTQWYILFNVIAGAMAIPNELKEASSIYSIHGLRKWKLLIFPSIFPYLLTGMITATGGAWNASIISEYITYSGKIHQTTGLGATIARAANSGNFHLLIASTATMALIVFCINRFGWQKLYGLAESKYHFE